MNGEEPILALAWEQTVASISDKLKAYSLMSNRGRFQNFENLIFFHISVALL